MQLSNTPTVEAIDSAVDRLTLGTIAVAADLLGLAPSLLLKALLRAPDELEDVHA